MNWRDRPRDGFGRLVVDPATLSRDERLAELRRCAGRLAADPDRGIQWLASGLLAWSVHGVDPADALGLRPPRGSTRTVASAARLRARDAALLRLAAALGGDRRALRVLRGDEACPAVHQRLLDDALRLAVPTSPNAISRARRRHRPAR